jgi:hypothetical protein
MQNQPPDPQQYPPNGANAPYTQPIPPTNPPYPQYPQYSQPLPPPYPPYSQPLPPYPPYPQPAPPPYPPYVSYAQLQDNSTAIVLEAILSLFGLYGIGWMYRGHIGIGIALLALGFVWVAVAVVISIFTLGFGLLCIGPLHLIFIVGDVLLLNNTLRSPWRR